MALLPILQFPDSRLRLKAKPVTVFDEKLQTLIDDMLETMYHAKGIGLAATQVNIQKQLVVIDLSEERNEAFCLINPKIVFMEGVDSIEEGCLSVPGFQEPVQRAASVTVEALDRRGNAFNLTAEGLLAICIQHELDHLQGKLFVDHISSLKRDRIRKKLEKKESSKATA